MSLGAWFLAAIYDRQMSLAEEACLRDWRRELLAPLDGEVLEVGAGTGGNLGHYPERVTRLVVAEPDRYMRRHLERRVAAIAEERARRATPVGSDLRGGGPVSGAASADHGRSEPGSASAGPLQIEPGTALADPPRLELGSASEGPLPIDPGSALADPPRLELGSASEGPLPIDPGSASEGPLPIDPGSASEGPPRIEVSSASLDSLPFENQSFDAVVCTLVLCSVGDPARALAEIHRVLRPGGRLVFIEHVAAEDRPDRLVWQRRLEPLWKRVAGNCHVTRRTEQAISAAGFDITEITRASMRKAMPIVRPTIRGYATKVG